MSVVEFYGLPLTDGTCEAAISITRLYFPAKPGAADKQRGLQGVEDGPEPFVMSQSAKW